GLAAPASRSVALLEANVAYPARGELASGFAVQPRDDLDARDLAAAQRKQCRQVAASRADLQRRLLGLELELLEHARLPLRRPHPLVVAERDLEVRESERPVRRGNEVLAVHREEQVENALVEHLPGADLLLDHVEARLLEVHAVL